MTNAIENGQICKTTEQAIRHGTGNLSHVPGLVKKIIRTQAWTEREIGPNRIVKLGSLLELVTTKPMADWGEDPKKIEALLRDDAEALAMWREATKGKEGGDKRSKEARTTGDIVNGDVRPATKKGNSRAYTVARLQRESPELFEQVKAGELSANAAAIKAGFRKVKTPDEQAVAAWKKSANRLCVLKGIIDSLEQHELTVLKEWLT